MSLSISINRKPITDKIILVIDNEDNPPLTLTNFEFYYPVTRIFFKAKPNEDTYLYYGNPEVRKPRYDITLVTNEILYADKKIAHLGKEKILHLGSWWKLPVPSGFMRVVFWIVMSLVVVSLLFVIAKLLPKES